MNFPTALHIGDTIGVCAPSAGVQENLLPRFENAIRNVEGLGYKVIVTQSVRRTNKCVSSSSKIRADEFMSLYMDPDVKAIIPPWGGEFLMDMLPYLNYEQLSSLPPKWICGYSDLTTLTFSLTLMCDIATIHGSNFMNMGCKSIHFSDMQAFEAMSNQAITQKSSEYWGSFSSFEGISKETYILDKRTELRALEDEKCLHFSGRMIGGCMDTLCKLLGTRYAPIQDFLEKYKQDGFIWTLESAEMSAGDIYRTLWQMSQCGLFKNCNGIIFGRPDGYRDTGDFTLIDALSQGLGGLNVPVIYNADIGHIPPQMQIINGAYGTVAFEKGVLTLGQEQKS